MTDWLNFEQQFNEGVCFQLLELLPTVMNFGLLERQSGIFSPKYVEVLGQFANWALCTPDGGGGGVQAASPSIHIGVSLRGLVQLLPSINKKIKGNISLIYTRKTCPR